MLSSVAIKYLFEIVGCLFVWKGFQVQECAKAAINDVKLCVEAICEVG